MTLPTESLEVKPTEVPSELVPQLTHSMMEGNRKEEKKKKKNWNDNNVNEREKGSDGSTLQRHHAFLGYLSARGSEGLAFP